MLDPVDITLGPAYKRNLNKNMLVIKRYSLYPNFLNIDVNQKCSFPSKKFTRYSWVLVLTKLVVSGVAVKTPLIFVVKNNSIVICIKSCRAWLDFIKYFYKQIIQMIRDFNVE